MIKTKPYVAYAKEIQLGSLKCIEKFVRCDICSNPVNNNDIIYHCPKTRINDTHPNGFDVCLKCYQTTPTNNIINNQPNNQTTITNNEKDVKKDETKKFSVVSTILSSYEYIADTFFGNLVSNDD